VDKHRMLRRQLVRHFGTDLPTDPRLRAFLDDVNAAYQEADHGRTLLERALDLTSTELFERNLALHEATSGGDVGIWTLDPGAQLSLQGFPLPCVPDTHRRVMVSVDEFLAKVGADERAAVAAAFATQNERIAIRFWVDDERGRRWLEVRGRRRPNAIGMAGICIDVTHACHALEQQQLLRAVIDTAPNLIFAKDREGRFTLVNAAVAALYGTTPEGLVGKTDADFNDDAEQLEHFRRDDLDVMDTLEERFIAEEQVTDSHGCVHWFQTVKRPLVGPDGRGHQVLGISTDITDRRRAEEERVRLEDSLRQAQRLESLGLLAGGVAHDFNNLLTPILVYTEMISEGAPAGSEFLEHTAEIQSAALRARDLTGQLLAFGRKQTLTMIALDLNAEVEQLRSMLSRIVPASIELGVDREPDLPQVLADRTQIHQILMNLAANACDAMPDGGRLRFITRADREQQQVLLTVADTGSGMDAETQAQIFEPFFTTKALGKGTGLGLATVYGAVQQHAGTIEVESSPGLGTRFLIRLPAVRVAAREEETTKIPVIRSRARTTILIVEDDARVLRLVGTLLRRRSFEVLVANHPDAALSLAREHPGSIDLLLSDVVMPGLNGVEMHRRMVEHRANLRVLYMTGYSQDAFGVGGRVEVDHRILRKPFTSADLFSAIDAVLATQA
jgi:two-component system cell cycle sensor histidine kinase/response regulator CckA